MSASYTKESLTRLLDDSSNLSINQIKRLLDKMNSAELAHCLESSPPKQRKFLWSLIDNEDEGDVLADLGDEIQFVWKQIAGPSVEINPHPFAGKVSFEGKEGEYTFELTVSDNYNSKTTITKTVVIIPEPNQAPVIDMKVRQGSELK